MTSTTYTISIADTRKGIDAIQDRTQLRGKVEWEASNSFTITEEYEEDMENLQAEVEEALHRAGITYQREYLRTYSD